MNKNKIVDFWNFCKFIITMYISFFLTLVMHEFNYTCFLSAIYYVIIYNYLLHFQLLYTHWKTKILHKTMTSQLTKIIRFEIRIVNWTLRYPKHIFRLIKMQRNIFILDRESIKTLFIRIHICKVNQCVYLQNNLFLTLQYYIPIAIPIAHIGLPFAYIGYHYQLLCNYCIPIAVYQFCVSITAGVRP